MGDQQNDGQTGGTGGQNDGQGNGGAGGTGAQGQGQQNNQQGNQGQQGGQQGQQSGGTGQGQDESQLPDWARRSLQEARDQAYKARTNKSTAAQEARDEILGQLSKALGLTKDEPLDPAKLAEDLKDRDGKLRDTTVQLAVLRAAPKAGGDPDALLDSRSFLDSLHSLDPASEGFAGQVQAAIEKAVRDNPRLGAGTPVTRGGGEIGGGTKDKGDDGEMTWEKADKLAKDARTRFGGGR